MLQEKAALNEVKVCSERSSDALRTWGGWWLRRFCLNARLASSFFGCLRSQRLDPWRRFSSSTHCSCLEIGTKSTSLNHSLTQLDQIFTNWGQIFSSAGCGWCSSLANSTQGAAGPPQDVPWQRNSMLSKQSWAAIWLWPWTNPRLQPAGRRQGGLGAPQLHDQLRPQVTFCCRAQGAAFSLSGTGVGTTWKIVPFCVK